VAWREKWMKGNGESQLYDDSTEVGVRGTEQVKEGGGRPSNGVRRERKKREKRVFT